MRSVKRRVVLGTTALAGLALSACLVSGCTAGGLGGNGVSPQAPRYRITKVTVDGLMGSKERIPTIDYLYRSDGENEELRVADWVKYAFPRTGYSNIDESEGVLSSCEWNLDYDAVGHLLSKTWSDDAGQAGGFTYTYDDNGNELTARSTFGDTVIAESTKEYNNDVLVQSEQYVYAESYNSPDDGIRIVEKESPDHQCITYDDHGNVVERSADYSYMSTQSTHSYEYDDRGNILVDIYKFGAGFVWETTYTYDSNNEVLSETIESYSPVTEDNSTRLTEWTRTDDGKPLTQIIYINGSQATQTTWEYDDSGNVLLITYDDPKHIAGDSDKYEYVYDDCGREIEMTKTNDEGIVEESRTTEYASDGTATMQTVSRESDGDILMECTCTFDDCGNPTLFKAHSATNGQDVELMIEYEQF